jgi:alpha-tubulin suppressor-like RCC1 family protein
LGLRMSRRLQGSRFMQAGRVRFRPAGSDAGTSPFVRAAALILQPPDPLSGISAIAMDLGNSHTCAIVPAGAVKCWGGNDRGQLGIGNTTDMYSPVDVGLVSGL